MLRITAKDVRGVVTYPPTPCKEGAGEWDSPNSVDLDKAEKMINLLIGSGTGVLGLNGTTGENAALLFEEKRDYIATAVKTANKRVPIFAGCTALGTKEVVRQMRVMRDLGAPGCFIGLPLWQTPTMKMQVKFYRDLGEAVPDMGIMIYSNQMFFKSDFNTEFWEGIAREAPTVVTNKAGSAAALPDHVRVAGHQVNFVPITGQFVEADKRAPGKFNALWNTTFAPEPLVAFINAFNSGDRKRADEIMADITSIGGESNMMQQGPARAEGYPIFSSRMLTPFASFNAQVHKVEWNASGYLPGGVGPFRAPYTDFPEEWVKPLEEHARKWMKMREKYVKVAVK